MTAPKLDEARLRELAEAATPGPWWDQSHRAPQARVFNVGSDVGNLIARVHEGNPKRAEANAAFIAAANPATILALLDALSRERGDRAEKLTGYAPHDDDCTVNRYPGHDACSCGLSPILQAVRHEATQSPSRTGEG